jgi:hypothetical protein
MTNWRIDPDASGDLAGNTPFRRSFNPMPLISTQTFQPRPSPKEAIPYSSAALRQDLERLRGIWEDSQLTGIGMRFMRT